jgi:hypothetical protein
MNNYAKQSQFAKRSKTNVTTVLVRDYENEHLRTRPKNKAKTNPISKGNMWLIPNARVLQEMSIFVEFCQFFHTFCQIFTRLCQILSIFYAVLAPYMRI